MTAQPPLVVKQLPTQFDVDFISGDDLSMRLTVKVNGVAAVWTGAVFTQSVVTSSGLPAPGNAAFTIQAPANGKIVLFMSKTMTAALGQADYVWWLAVTLNGLERTLYHGRLRSLSRTTVR